MSEPSRWENIKEQLSDGSVRIRYFGGLAILLVAAIVGYLLFARNVNKVQGTDRSEVASVPDVAAQSRNGNADQQKSTAIYDKLLEQQNANAAEQARKNGESAVPAIRNRDAVDTKADAPAPAAAPPAQSAQEAAQQAAAETAAAQKRQEEAQKRQQEMTLATSAMKGQVNLLVKSWEPKPHTNIPVTVPPKDSLANGQLAGATGTPSATVSTVANATTPAATTNTGKTVIKAGDLPDYGELLTAVNTDEAGPVMAKVVSGALNGATLLGKAEVAGPNSQKAGLHFTTASIPGQTNSIAIDAWAIDPETARTAIATHVDNHYLLRYGSLFASAFLGGYGDALIKGGQNQQLITSPSGSIVQTDQYSNKQLMLAGIGNVGKQASTSMASVFNRPSTIEISPKIGIGILFTSDVTLK